MPLGAFILWTGIKSCSFVLRNRGQHVRQSATPGALGLPPTKSAQVAGGVPALLALHSRSPDRVTGAPVLPVLVLLVSRQVQRTVCGVRIGLPFKLFPNSCL